MLAFKQGIMIYIFKKKIQCSILGLDNLQFHASRPGAKKMQVPNLIENSFKSQVQIYKIDFL